MTKNRNGTPDVDTAIEERLRGDRWRNAAIVVMIIAIISAALQVWAAFSKPAVADDARAAGTVSYDTITCTAGNKLVWYHIGEKLAVGTPQISPVTGYTAVVVSQNGQFLTLVEAQGLHCYLGYNVINAEKDPEAPIV